jgi:hypothetical protein
MGMMNTVAPSTVATLTDELDRYVVQVAGAADRGVPDLLAFALDRAGLGQRLTLLTNHEGDPFLYRHELIGQLCRTRALACVDRQVHLGGQAVSPERLLRAWRKALDRSLSFAWLARNRLALRLTLRGHVIDIERLADRWVADMGVFDALADMFGPQWRDAKATVDHPRVAMVLDDVAALNAATLQWAFQGAFLYSPVRVQIQLIALEGSRGPGAMEVCHG